MKQTPAGSVPVDAATGRPKLDAIQWGINPFDEYAVEEALRIKERVAGSHVSVVSVGPARAEEAIRAALSLGCDDGFLVSDAAFDGSDPNATGYLLSLAVKKTAEVKGPVHLVLCGKQTSDVGAGQVGLALGAWLDWPAAAFVRKIPTIDETKAVVDRMMEDGVDAIELQLPAVVSVVKEINEPRLPSLKGKMAAKKAPVAKWGIAELSADASGVGANSPTTELKTSAPPPRGAGIKVPGATPQEKAAFLVQKFKELKVI
ncbi:MAG: electron transfer flavoprotein subunit beta/FixA family protein [Elusimicrobia bacterium]|nr:electron transfer flavoprotein subunit beta/FixA family protein [Elusimicrobiota bacterium]